MISDFSRFVATALAAVAIVAPPVATARSLHRGLSYDEHGEILYATRNETTGEVVAPELLDQRGEPLENPRIMLEKRAGGWDYGGAAKVRGVNIGGWLVAEPFITPSLFDNTGDSRVVDELTMGKYVSDACSRMAKHWATWYTADDFHQIKAAGLNHVRIPIGYWAFDDQHTTYCKGNQFEYLTKAVGWAKQYGLKVMIDLHGAPHSQNGFDNSGHRTDTPGWFNSQTYATRAKDVISTIAQRFTQPQYTDTVTSIQLLNEPLTSNGDSTARLSFTQSYFQDAYYAVRYAQGSTATSVNVAIHDSFQPLSTWDNFMRPTTFQNVLIDHHQYTVFNNDIYKSHTERLQEYCGLRSSISSANNKHYLLVGEWTVAPTDCAKYLNGRGKGARYDGSISGFTSQGSCSKKTGSGDKFSSTYKQQLKELFDTQRNVYETGVG